MLMLIFPDTIQAEEIPKVLFFGDSLTAGYDIPQKKAYPQLIKEIAEKEGLKIDIINGGVSGDTSGDAIRRLPRYLKSKVDIGLIALGTNDIFRGVPVPALKENLIKIIDTLRAKNPDIKIILSGMKMPLHIDVTDDKSYEVVFSEVSKEKKTIFLPFLLEGVAGVDEMTLEDRLHPSEKGHTVMAALVWPIIKELL